MGTGFAVGHGRPPLVLVCGAVERGAAVEVVGGVDVGTSTAAEEAQRGMRECRWCASSQFHLLIVDRKFDSPIIFQVMRCSCITNKARISGLSRRDFVDCLVAQRVAAQSSRQAQQIPSALRGQSQRDAFSTFEVLDRATFSAWHGSSLDQGLSRPDVAPKASDVEGRLSDAIGRAACGFDKGVREDGVERARR